MPKPKKRKPRVVTDEAKKDATKVDVLRVWQSAYDEALSDELDRVQFAKYPRAELFSFACKAAKTRVDEYARKRLSDTEFAEYRKARDVFNRLYSVIAVTPMKRMLYWAERLGICDADGEVEHVLGAVSRYLIAQHKIQDYTIQQMAIDDIANILEHDATQASKKTASSERGRRTL